MHHTRPISAAKIPVSATVAPCEGPLCWLLDRSPEAIAQAIFDCIPQRLKGDPAE